MTARPVLAIGNRRYSSWSLRPWLLLRQFAVDFDTELLPLRSEAFRRDIVRWSPSGRVPALRHGDIVVWDSLAICEYANETFLDGRGWPAERAARAHARAIVAEMHSGFVALRSECPMNVCRRLDAPLPLSDAARADVARVEAIWREARARFGAGGPFLYGAFSIADAFYAPVATRLRTYAVPVSAGAAAWVETVHALPAMQEWIAAAAAEAERIDDYERLGRP
jgi:glutathione S-transferase